MGGISRKYPLLRRSQAMWMSRRIWQPRLVFWAGAISIGLIATELVTNALKYAYPDGQGEVRVRLSRVDDKVALEVADDGIGWTGTGAIKGTGLGSKIVSAMARSLATELRYEQREGRGTHAVMELSLSGLAPPEAADG